MWLRGVRILTLLCIYLFCECVQTLEVNCSRLLIGQYVCPEPEVDKETQQPEKCTQDNIAPLTCQLAEGLTCRGTAANTTFDMDIPCKYTNGYSFETALLLSIFLGMFGMDRFYLGYPAIGLLKFCTLGFMFLGQLIDIILIATQVVGPADGSNYIINYFGAGLSKVSVDEGTYRVPQGDWT